MKSKNHYDIIIIGGGASGLCTAIMAKTAKNSILIIEHNDRVGKKILSTGNGKCNLTNLGCKVSSDNFVFAENPEGIKPYYSAHDNGFAEQVISEFDAEKAIAFFENLGMIPLNKNGYIYPRSEQAASVLDLLRFRCEELGVEILCGYQPVKIQKIHGGGFRIDDDFSCEKLIIAAGGQSASKTGSDGSGYELAKALGHKIIKPLPALCALKCSDPFFKELAGVRTDAKLHLFDLGEKDKVGNSKGQAKELVMIVYGNLQFNNYGISGIPVFQLSLIASRLLAESHEILVKIDLLPELSEDELAGAFAKKIQKYLEHGNGKDNFGKNKVPSSDIFLGILNKKLANVIEKESKKAHPNEKPEEYAFVYTHMIKRFKVHPTETVSFEEAQTTLGGVSTEEIDPKTMESKLVEGLYFTGEIVDVSGICGGYNLQWAWASAHAAATGLKG